MEHYQYINIERTLKEFGYHIKDLKPSSCKSVYRICQICKKESLKQYRTICKVKQYKCSDCSNKINANTNKDIRNKKIKENWVKNGHSRLGKKHSEKTKKQISEKCKDYKLTPEQLEKLREYHRTHESAFKGKKHTKDSKDKMSVIHKKIARRGRDCHFYGKCYPSKRCNFTDKNGRIFYMRSSWEIKIAQYLDFNNIKWDYEKQCFPVTYIYDGIVKDGTYIPDFFLENEIWEIKGFWRKYSKAKYDAFLKQYPNIKIKVLFKEDLENLGIKLK